MLRRKYIKIFSDFAHIWGGDSVRALQGFLVTIGVKELGTMEGVVRLKFMSNCI